MKVTIYSQPGCPQCNATRRRLARLGVEFIEADVSTDPWALLEVRDLGYRAVPVVVAGERHWAGFRPDLIDALA